MAFEVTGQRLFDFGLGDLAARAPRCWPCPLRYRRCQFRRDGGRLRMVFAWRKKPSGKTDEAVAAYRKAWQLIPGWPPAHTNLGSLAYDAGRSGAARASFEAALSLNPEQTEARYNLAGILYEQGEVELAASELRRVVQQPWISPTRTTTWPPPSKTWAASVRQWSTCGATWIGRRRWRRTRTLGRGSAGPAGDDSRLDRRCHLPIYMRLA